MSGQAVIRRFLANQCGATAIEYGLVAGMMTVVVVSIAATGGALDGIYEKLAAIVLALGGQVP